MAKQIKQKKIVADFAKSDRKILKYLIAFPIVAFLIKMIVMINLKNGGWYGADGENYFAAIDGLLLDGFFSERQVLNYWPAGYPILLWPFGIIAPLKILYLASFTQSIFFAFSTYFFTKKILESHLKYLAFGLAFLISFNPTLSLNSLAIGYEVPVASCLMMALGYLLQLRSKEPNRFHYKEIALSSIWLSLTCFMQPRYLVVAFALMILVGLKYVKRTNLVIFVGIVGILIMILPLSLIIRNTVAIDKATISTNLGSTMQIGSGPQTSGGYDHVGPNVECKANEETNVLTENDLIRCISLWYLTNPLKTLKLAFNKSQYYWSPWSGPLVNGTMARNPYLKISPIQNIRQSADGRALVDGGIGKTVSAIWILAQIGFLFGGFIYLYRTFAAERILTYLLFSPIILGWLVSIATIGDHRFRIPTMPLSLLFQYAAFMQIRKKITKVI
jgi:hypothetical protein